MSVKLGRNDPCWCGSGKKYKACHAAFDDKLARLAQEGHVVPTHDLIKTPDQIAGIKESAKINVAVLDYIEKNIHAGMNTAEIDKIVYDMTTSMGGIPAPLNYEGYPYSVCTSVNEQVCHGFPSEKVIADAATMIMAGEADIVVAGGMENMSMAPYAMTKARFGYRMNNATIIDTMVNDALTDAFNHYHMMITAENVCDKYGITREELDEFSANSQQKCEAAIAAGKFDDEIVPVPVKVKKEMVDFKKDEGPRAGTTAESLSKLRCCSGKEGGLVTAGNASGINDGAAAIVVMSEEKAKELGVTPMATWVAGALGGVEPEIMGVGPVASTKKVLAKTGLSIDDFDLIEANEAFAAQSIAVARDLKFDMSKVNVNGGAIALGHPVGASGCRILVTLLHEMQKRGSNRGLATLCIGGGMGCSTIVEKY